MNDVKVRCTKDGISVEGARDIGSTSDTIAGSLSQFLRIAECWWNTYCEKSPRQGTDCHGNAAAMRAALEIAHDYFNSGGTLRTDAAKAVEAALTDSPTIIEEYDKPALCKTCLHKPISVWCGIYRCSDYEEMEGGAK